MKKTFLILAAAAMSALLFSCTSKTIVDLPRTEAPEAVQAAFDTYVSAVDTLTTDEIHSIMIVQHGKVLEEKWFGDWTPEKPHVMWSVSKTWTATAVGIAIDEGLLSLDDKLVSFFPEELPDTVSENLAAVTIRNLLTMNCGHEKEPVLDRRDSTMTWTKAFLAWPVTKTPGTWYCYNSFGTYMLSAIVQKVTGEKVVDYLTPRLFEPLHIEKPEWDESPQGINCGGWGLHIKTEDMAKLGQLFLNGGKWNGKQIVSKEWIQEAMKEQVPCVPSGVRPDQQEALGLTKENSDWVQGYGYQMWRCRHNGVRADGAFGQYIIILPDLDAVVAMTARVGNMQKEINMVWDIILPALEASK